MLRVLIIECLLFALFGAVAFRLLYAFIARTWVVWVISLLLIALISALTSGVVDPHLVLEFGGDTLTGFSPGMLLAARAVAVDRWLRAGLAGVAPTRRIGPGTA